MSDGVQARIEAMPRVLFLCGRDWYGGPDDYVLGVFWGKRQEGIPFASAYRRGWSVRLKIRLRFERVSF
jgi:hypothetical protein